MAIKHKTYNNFMKVMKKIIQKGYSKDEAYKLTMNIFDEFEENPQGLPIESRIGLIVSVAN